MNSLVRAPWYDLFKLIVAILLAILFVYLIWDGGGQSALGGIPLATVTALVPTSLHTGTPTPPPPPTFTNTPTPAVTPTQTPTPEPDPAPTETATPEPVPTAEPAPATEAPPAGDPTSPPQGQVSYDEDVCAAALSRSRLEVGRQATIVRRLNFRTSPGIENNWVLTNIPGTQVDVIGGPVCVPYFIGAHLWWEIRLPNGQTGWSAEASWRGAFTFMEPS